MKASHLSDQEIQRYVFATADCEQAIITHLQTCDHCRNRAKTYELIEASLQNEPAPAFDFDLAALVMNELPTQEEKFSIIEVLAYSAGFVGLGALSIVIYFFGRDLLVLFSGVSNIAIYMILCIVGMIFLPLCWEVYQSYQRRIRMLDFS